MADEWIREPFAKGNFNAFKDFNIIKQAEKNSKSQNFYVEILRNIFPEWLDFCVKKIEKKRLFTRWFERNPLPFKNSQPITINEESKGKFSPSKCAHNSLSYFARMPFREYWLKRAQEDV